jgi:hypothetical protein
MSGVLPDMGDEELCQDCGEPIDEAGESVVENDCPYCPTVCGTCGFKWCDQSC